MASPHARDSKVLSCGRGDTSCPGFESDIPPPTAKACAQLIPLRSSSNRRLLLASEEPEALPVKKGCQEAGDMARLGSA